MKFVIYRIALENAGGEREWRWRLVAANNRILASGEGYKRKGKCVRVVDLLKGTNASTPVEIRPDV